VSASLAIIKPRAVKPPRYPLSAEIQYARILASIVEKIRILAKQEIAINGPDIIEQVNIIFMRKDAISPQTGWGKVLNDLLERIALGITEVLLAALNKIATIAATTNNLHKQDFLRQVHQAYGGNPLAVNILSNERGLPDLLSAWEQTNLELVKSIPDTVIGQLRSQFTQAFVNGTTMSDLADIVEERAGVGKSRAKLIARDQIGKLNGQLSEMRHKAAGIDSYKWITMHDERVRPTHRVRDGKIYSWNDQGIKPGQEIRCRCVASPVFPEL